MIIRNGKIARLPIHIREQLNLRLLENEPGKQLVEWLNAQSEVIAILDSQFEGRLISEQNLSEWRRGGYVAWQFLHDCLEHAELASEGAEHVDAIGVNSQRLISIITARLAELLNNWAVTFDLQTGVYAPTGPRGTGAQKHGSEIAYNQRMLGLQDLLKAALALRKSEQRDERLALDRERLELLRERQSRKSPSSASSPKSSSAESAPASDASASADSSAAEERSAVNAGQKPPSIPPDPANPPDASSAPTPPTAHGAAPTESFPRPRDHRVSSLTECAVIDPVASTLPAITPQAPVARTASPRNPRGLL